MVEVQRAAVTPQATGKGSASTGSDRSRQSQRKENTAVVRLEQGSSINVQASGLDGMVDQGALQQGSYLYTAQRVLSITIAGKVMQIRSEPTAPITIAMRDTFPPMPPKGLVSVPVPIRTGTIETGQRAIDLTWEPSTDADLNGYLVYRADLTTSVGRIEGKPVRLTHEPLAGPAFRDNTVVLGHRYRYHVTAIDQNGNESGPSTPIEDTAEGR